MGGSRARVRWRLRRTMFREAEGPAGDGRATVPDRPGAPRAGRGRFGFPAWVAPRWRKVWRDLWAHRSRTVLVVMSIAIGVFSIGVVSGTRQILARDLAATFAAINPASATVTMAQPFDEDLVRSVAAMPEVDEAEGRRAIFVRVQTGPDTWTNMQLNAIADFENMRLDKVLPHEGAWPPPEKTISVERAGLGLVKAGIGDTLVIKTPSGKRRSLPISGTSYDAYALPYKLDGMPFAYVSYETLEWLGEPRDFNELHFTVAEGRGDRAHIGRVVDAVRAKLERDGRAVYFMTVPEPGKHPLDGTIQAILMLLGAMGALALALSGFLVVNTVAAVLAQELRFIGVMKAIGARRGQIAGMYLAMVALYGLLALGLALPLGALGTLGFSRLMAGFLDLDVRSAAVPPDVFAMQLLVALVVPLLAALVPVLLGTRITVREAVSAYGLGKGRFGLGRVDRAIERIRGLPRPVLLSLRNTFRRKTRLGLTLVALTLAGSMFMGILSIYSSIQATLDQLISLWQWDVAMQLSQSYRIDRLRQEALSVPGVTDAEGWSFISAQHTTADEGGGMSMLGLSVPLFIFAPPAETKLLQPTLLRGRWLEPGDQNALVVSASILDDQPGLDLGGEIGLKIQGRDSTWRVVGVSQGIGPTPIAYANYDYFSRYIREAGHAQWLALVTAGHDPATQAAVAERLEAAFENAGIGVAVISRLYEERAEAAALFQGIVAMLLVMVLILAFVGALGLAGTMSLNVIERTREIGVMRAIGASDWALRRIFIVEGVMIGLLSWLLGTLLAVPLSYALSYGMGMALLQSPLAYAFSVPGVLLWLAIVTGVAILASLMPARAAGRVTVREVLAYE